MVAVISVFISLIILCWVAIFLLINDFSISTKSIDKNKKILVIYPHPDDEILTVGGLMSKNQNTTLLILTKGERGTPNANTDLRLKEIRNKEEQASSRILHVKKIIHKDYGDGELENKTNAITQEILGVVKKENPELIITYDLSGFYGHPDHMAVSQIVTNLVKSSFKKIELWYATVPKRTYQLLKVPEQMAKDKNFKIKRTYPTHKVFVGLNVINKIQANRVHKSQYKPFQGGLQIPIPVAFFQSMTLFEYFYKAN